MEKMMRNGFVPFESERFMSNLERHIDYNLSGSGVPTLSIKELVKEPEFMEKVLSKRCLIRKRKAHSICENVWLTCIPALQPITS